MPSPRKATLRKSGSRMYTIRVDFAIGIDDIAAVLYRTWTVDDLEIPKSRAEVWKAVKEDIFREGRPDKPSTFDFASERSIAEVYRVAGELFPELKAN